MDVRSDREDVLMSREHMDVRSDREDDGATASTITTNNH